MHSLRIQWYSRPDGPIRLTGLDGHDLMWVDPPRMVDGWSHHAFARMYQSQCLVRGDIDLLVLKAYPNELLPDYLV